MLLFVLDIWETVNNDIDIMHQAITQFTTTSQTYKYLKKEYRILETRLQYLVEKIKEEIKKNG